jgi:hypothetical protein
MNVLTIDRISGPTLLVGLNGLNGHTMGIDESLCRDSRVDVPGLLTLRQMPAILRAVEKPVCKSSSTSAVWNRRLNGRIATFVSGTGRSRC